MKNYGIYRVGKIMIVLIGIYVTNMENVLSLSLECAFGTLHLYLYSIFNIHLFWRRYAFGKMVENITFWS